MKKIHNIASGTVHYVKWSGKTNSIGRVKIGYCFPSHGILNPHELCPPNFKEVTI